MRNGISAFAISPIFRPDTVEAEKMFTATGGVMVPTTLEMHTIMPKWITSMPILWAIGQRTGTKRTAIAVPSMNVPKISRIMATTKQNSAEFKCMLITAFTSAWEAPEKVNTQEKAVEAAMMNKIMAELFAESFKMGTSSFTVSSL